MAECLKIGQEEFLQAGSLEMVQLVRTFLYILVKMYILDLLFALSAQVWNCHFDALVGFIADFYLETKLWV